MYSQGTRAMIPIIVDTGGQAQSIPTRPKAELIAIAKDLVDQALDDLIESLS